MSEDRGFLRLPSSSGSAGWKAAAHSRREERGTHLFEELLDAAVFHGYVRRFLLDVLGEWSHLSTNALDMRALSRWTAQEGKGTVLVIGSGLGLCLAMGMLAVSQGALKASSGDVIRAMCYDSAYDWSLTSPLGA